MASRTPAKRKATADTAEGKTTSEAVLCCETGGGDWSPVAELSGLRISRQLAVQFQ